MTPTWTPTAETDLQRIVDHIAARNVVAALQTEDRIVSAVGRLEAYPTSGRVGRWADTRELVIVGTAYLLIYRLSGLGVEILRVLHGAQGWPPESAA